MRVAIVDAYSSSNSYAKYFMEQGYSVFHIQSQDPIPNAYRSSFKPWEFERNFVWSSSLLEELKHQSIDCVLAGMETGVEVADALSEGLKLITNGTKLSACRRDKYQMLEQVKNFGLRIPRQKNCKNVDEILAWKNLNDLNKIVLKPPKSAGSDLVSVVEGSAEIKHIFSLIFGAINRLGIKNEFVLAQEYIEGQEYAVNAVSTPESVQFTHIWAYHKRVTSTGDFIYDYENLLPGDGEREKQIYDYVSKVLRALGIRYGASHTEIMIDRSGPVLIECAARIDGIANPEFDEKIVPQNQIELAVKTWIEKHSKAKGIIPYRAKKFASNVSLISNHSGYIEDIVGLNLLKSLPSYVDLRLRAKVGEMLFKTKDIFSSPGVVFLAHASWDQIMEDYKILRDWEGRGEFFILKDI